MTHLNNMKLYAMMTAALAVLSAVGLASAHMEMSDPPPFRSKYNPNVQNVDYSMTNPLGVFPCKGYHSDFGTVAGRSVATWAAGSQQSMTIEGGASHGGGSCQASLSFDGGNTFKVIHSYIGNCPIDGQSSYSFKVPADVPNGEAIFSWTWMNRIGNREMYMNCAAITITGGTDDKTALDLLPDVFVANLASVNSCKTAEGTDVVFPDPGEFVDNSSSNPAPPVGDCPAAVSNGTPSATKTETPVETPTTITTPVASPPTSYAPTATPEASTTTGLPGGIFLPQVSSTLSTVTRSTPPTECSAAPTTPTGSVGEMPAGEACPDEGVWNCIAGTAFQRCASGRWSVMMDMAAGTRCETGITTYLWEGGADRRRRLSKRIAARMAAAM